MSSRLVFGVWGIVAVGVTGCMPEEEALPEAQIAELSSMEQGERDFIEEMFADYEGKPGWPDSPQRFGSITNVFSNETTLTVGVAGSFFDIVEGEASASMVLGLGHRTNLMLAKHAEGGYPPLTRTNGDGNVYLAYEEGVDFVGVCTYTAFLNIGSRFFGMIKVAGSGIENQTDFAKETEVYLSTNFFPIEEGDTVGALEKRCERAFDRSLKHSVATDLRNLIGARARVEADEVDQLYHGLQAALFGPQRKRLYIFGHHWNVKPVTWFRHGRDEERFTIQGWLSHNIHGRIDDQVYYEFEYDRGELVRESIDIGGDGAWQQAARKLIEMIGDEVYREHRTGLHNMDPGAPQHATAYEHSWYRGAERTIGVGHYNVRFLQDAGLQDEITSFRVPKGLRITAYEHANFEGHQWVYDADNPNVGDGVNDEISSMKVEPDPNYPRRYVLKAPDADHRVVMGDDGIVSSQYWYDDHAQWSLEHTDAGHYTLLNRGTGMLVVMPTDDGAPDAAHWALVQVDDEDPNRERYYVINRNSGWALTRNGRDVYLTPATGAANQEWRFE